LRNGALNQLFSPKLSLGLSRATVFIPPSHSRTRACMCLDDKIRKAGSIRRWQSRKCTDRNIGAMQRHRSLHFLLTSTRYVSRRAAPRAIQFTGNREQRAGGGGQQEGAMRPRNNVRFRAVRRRQVDNLIGTSRGSISGGEKKSPSPRFVARRTGERGKGGEGWKEGHGGRARDSRCARTLEDDRGGERRRVFRPRGSPHPALPRRPQIDRNVGPRCNERGRLL